ncbi:uncharacterized protein ColSpa_02060 [Colletotrichum spaethianum]|uniref:Uncharacterized protein n=1 Tax=Colletotrichum spaethianum TaxID=700344 RepID=A0AA37L8D4_9PEZI|nr:uncharacterized protein ColSpa_02060 [Colletotrichum spaethianum]GKT41879.1 hypothetical protein ColSpa_02060 [Colletotrichum spaethianum]
MASIVTCPPEIVARILGSCASFTDGLALATSCNYVHNVWLDHDSTIVESIGSRSIPAYEHAVITIRATNLVKEAFYAGQLPPTFTHINRLGPRFKRCCLSELGDLLDFHHLACCLEYAYLHIAEDGYACFSNPTISEIASCSDEAPELPWRIREFQERFHRVFYRTLLAGAVLWKAHNEPFVQDAVEAHAGAWESRFDWPPASQAHTEYFSRFPVYNVHAMDWASQQEVFGPLTKYFMEDIASLTNPVCEADVPWEVMASIYAYEYQRPHFYNDKGRQRHGIAPRTASSDSNNDIKTRKVTVILLGEFQLEQISMPVKVEEMHSAPLVAAQLQISPTRSSEDGRTFACHGLDISALLQSRYESLGGEENDSDCAPHPPLQLFTFMLRKHYRLQFRRGVFDRTWGSAPYCQFLFFLVFAHEPDSDLEVVLAPVTGDP